MQLIAHRWGTPGGELRADAPDGVGEIADTLLGIPRARAGIDVATPTPTPTPAVADALARAEAAEQERDHAHRELHAQYARTKHAVLRFQSVCSMLATAAGQAMHSAMVPNVTTEDAERWIAALAARAERAEGERDEARAQNGAEAIVASGYMDERDRAIEERDAARARLAAAERVGEVEQSCEECAGTGEVDTVDTATGDEQTADCDVCGGSGRVVVTHRAAHPARPSTPAAEGESHA